MSISVKSVVLSDMYTNCYLLIDSETKKAAVVDPGEYCPKLEAMLKENSVEKLEYIFLTHGHFDHICGVQKLCEKFGGKIVISKEDEKCFKDGEISLCSVFNVPCALPEKADITVSDGDDLMLGQTKISVLETPGHTKGSVCYVFDSVIISGDTLFKGSMGRTDFPTGDAMQILVSLRKLCALEGDRKIYCGHGEATTLSHERENNPFCRF